MQSAQSQFLFSANASGEIGRLACYTLVQSSQQEITLRDTNMSIICGEKLNHVTDDDDSHRIIDDKDRVERRDPNPHDDKYTNSERARTPFLSVFGEVSIVRDFFLAAFSDGYNSVCD